MIWPPRRGGAWLPLGQTAPLAETPAGRAPEPPPTPPHSRPTHARRYARHRHPLLLAFFAVATYWHVVHVANYQHIMSREGAACVPVPRLTCCIARMGLLAVAASPPHPSPPRGDLY